MMSDYVYNKLKKVVDDYLSPSKGMRFGYSKINIDIFDLQRILFEREWFKNKLMELQKNEQT